MLLPRSSPCGMSSSPLPQPRSSSAPRRITPAPLYRSGSDIPQIPQPGHQLSRVALLVSVSASLYLRVLSLMVSLLLRVCLTYMCYVYCLPCYTHPSPYCLRVCLALLVTRGRSDGPSRIVCFFGRDD